MPKILMNVQRPHIYGSKRRKPGEQYEADGETHARLMVALGNASRAPRVEPTAAAAPAEPTGTYRRRDLVAEAPQPPARKSAPAKKSKSFQRRRDDAGSVE